MPLHWVQIVREVNERRERERAREKEYKKVAAGDVTSSSHFGWGGLSLISNIWQHLQQMRD